jgi:carbonic anhydrase
MCELDATEVPIDVPVARRAVLRLAATAAAGLAMAGQALAANVAGPPKAENVLAPQAALDRLMQGNARYVEGLSKRHDFKHEREALSKGQNPFAAVLSCADSRVAPEYCFDTGRGDLFVCRVAGNFASEDIVGSLEYAVQVLRAPLILVLAHESCGALEATIKSIKDGTTLPGQLMKLVTALTPAVTSAQGAPDHLLANAIRRNVTLTVAKLKTTAPILKPLVDEQRVRVVGGIYQLRTGQVELLA